MTTQQSKATPLLTNAELGTLIFIGSELMFFAAAYQCFLDNKSGAGGSICPAIAHNPTSAGHRTEYRGVAA